MPEGARIMVLAPLVEGRKGEFQRVFDDVRKAGFVRVRVDGEVSDLSEKIELEKNKKHSIAVVVDRLVVSRAGGRQVAHRRLGRAGAASSARAR